MRNVSPHRFVLIFSFASFFPLKKYEEGKRVLAALKIDLKARLLNLFRQESKRF